MRCIILALLLGALVFPKNTEALDCGTPLSYFPNSWQRTSNSDDVPVEEQRRGAEARATLERLERTPIIFRGRVASVRYLTDPRKTNTPTSLLAFDRVEVLKGRLITTSADRKAFILHEEWCDFRCSGRPVAMRWPPGKTFVVGADPNEFAEPSQAVDPLSKRLIYKGRIDAVVGMCRPGQLTPMALELWNASDDEIVRLKRDYQPRSLTDGVTTIGAPQIGGLRLRLIRPTS
jgi:hypothetical protein